MLWATLSDRRAVLIPGSQRRDLLKALRYSSDISQRYWANKRSARWPSDQWEHSTPRSSIHQQRKRSFYGCCISKEDMANKYFIQKILIMNLWIIDFQAPWIFRGWHQNDSEARNWLEGESGAHRQIAVTPQPIRGPIVTIDQSEAAKRRLSVPSLWSGLTRLASVTLSQGLKPQM